MYLYCIDRNSINKKLAQFVTLHKISIAFNKMEHVCSDFGYFHTFFYLFFHNGLPYLKILSF